MGSLPAEAPGRAVGGGAGGSPLPACPAPCDTLVGDVLWGGPELLLQLCQNLKTQWGLTPREHRVPLNQPQATGL